jgi:fumarylacetoacetate (FAA) hydrolase family protein
MSDLRPRPTDASESEASTSGPGAATAPRGTVEEVAAALPESATAAFAALLHLLRLMGADLALNRSDVDLERFEQAVRTKIEQFTSPTTNQSARDAGLAFARHLVEQVLTQIRAQVQIKKSLSIKRQTASAEKPATAAAEAQADPPKFLN